MNNKALKTKAKLKKAIILFLLGMSLIFPSCKIAKYLPLFLFILYIIGVFGMLILYYFWESKILRYISNRWVPLVGFVILLGLLLAGFFLFYPKVNSGVYGGGSDREEALNIAVSQLLNGNYPYYEKTFVPGLPHELGLDNNPISPFPGSLLLSLPFVLVGNSAYQNFFWLTILFYTLICLFRNNSRAFIVLVILIFGSPIILHEMITGGDLFSNSIWIFVFSYFFTTAIVLDKQTWKKWIFAILLGIGFSSRLHFLLISPIIFTFILIYKDFKTAFWYSFLVLVSFLWVTLPFYLYDPSGFSPLHTYDIIQRFKDVLPYSDIILLSVCFLFIIILSLKLKKNMIQLFGYCGLMLFIPVFYSVILSSVQIGGLELIQYTWYGLSFLFFASISLIGFLRNMDFMRDLH